MTDHQPDPGTDPVEAYATEYQRLWDATVATLTAAVQLDHPQHGPVDFSDFLASALGAVAANVGSAYRITAGRPGSWESDALSQLVGGTVGYDADPVVLAPRRTLPVIVPLNVAQLVTEAYQDAPTAQRETMLPHVDDAAQVLYRAGEEWSAQHPGPTEGAPAEEWDAYNAAVDAQAAQEEAAEELLRARLRSHLPGLRRSLHRGRTRHSAGHRAHRRRRGQGRDQPRGGVVGHHRHDQSGRRRAWRRLGVAPVASSPRPRAAPARARRDPGRGHRGGTVTASRTRPGRSWIVTGGVLALVGLAIILWPEPGFTPHPLPFPPSASTRPIAGYAVFGYPLLTLGLITGLAGALRAAVAAARSHRR